MSVAELIAALEGASGPDRRLDAEIACALVFHALRPARPDDHKDYHDGIPPMPGDIWCPTGFLMAAGYTRSIDDALTLVPPGYDWSLFYDNGEAIAGCMPASEDGCDTATTHAPTPALALCIAALRARTTP